MPINILPRQQQSFGLEGLGDLGQALGGALGQRQQVAQQIPGLQALFPQFSPEQLKGISSLPPALQAQAFKASQPKQDVTQLAQALGLIPSGQPGQEGPDQQTQEGRQAQGQDLSQFLKNAKPQDVFTAAKIKETQDRQQEAVQNKYKEFNEKYNKPLDESINLATRLESILQEMQELDATGKVITGLKGRYPVEYLNDKSQRYDALSNELVLLKTESLKGRPSDFKTKLQQLSKPHLRMKRSARQNLADRYLKDAQETLQIGEIRDQIYRELGGKEPENIKKLVRQRKQELELKNKDNLDELPDPAQYKGKKIANEETGEILVSNGREWIPQEGGRNGI